MRLCETEQLGFKPFATDTIAFMVADDRVPRKIELAGAGRVDALPVLTLFVPTDVTVSIGTKLTVNLLPGPRSATAGMHFEDSTAIPAPRIAECRLAFECIVLTTGSLDREQDQRQVVVARVLASYQRWPRGCAI